LDHVKKKFVYTKIQECIQLEIEQLSKEINNNNNNNTNYKNEIQYNNTFPNTDDENNNDYSYQIASFSDLPDPNPTVIDCELKRIIWERFEKEDDHAE